MKSNFPSGRNVSSSILKNNGLNAHVKKQVTFGEHKEQTYDREKGGISKEPVVTRALVNNTEQVAAQSPQENAKLTRTEKEMTDIIKKLAAQTNETTKRAEEAAMQARANQARANTTTTPTTIQHRREASAVNEQSPLENFATQSGKVMGGVAESAQVVGQNIQQVVGQNIQSLLNFSPFGGPAKAEAPRVAGPNNKKANTESSQTQSQGPRPEGSWEQRVTSDKGGGRGGRG